MEELRGDVASLKTVTQDRLRATEEMQSNLSEELRTTREALRDDILGELEVKLKTKEILELLFLKGFPSFILLLHHFSLLCSKTFELLLLFGMLLLNHGHEFGKLFLLLLALGSGFHCSIPLLTPDVALPLACKVDPQQLGKILSNKRQQCTQLGTDTHTKMSSLYKKMMALTGLLCARYVYT